MVHTPSEGIFEYPTGHRMQSLLMGETSMFGEAQVLQVGSAAKSNRGDTHAEHTPLPSNPNEGNPRPHTTSPAQSGYPNLDSRSQYWHDGPERPEPSGRQVQFPDPLIPARQIRGEGQVQECMLGPSGLAGMRSNPRPMLRSVWRW